MATLAPYTGLPVLKDSALAKEIHKREGSEPSQGPLHANLHRDRLCGRPCEEANSSKLQSATDREDLPGAGDLTAGVASRQGADQRVALHDARGPRERRRAAAVDVSNCCVQCAHKAWQADACDGAT
eukprot:CAMPEP_0178394078 /NCGR_PEP_ID=MMETSP0689_2-20121128/12516_1 /TAXON_ID=160604 /ORGANISM="Amphidinium massartii, Strain CS-259" /LENGTH=126 /DNA_ID=CAMNT_0020014687 /DNA_START=448 /DNA_END=829 /DNA_ORIENTATION=-